MNMNMRRGEKQLLRELSSDVDSFEEAFEAMFVGDDADAPIVTTTKKSADIGALGRASQYPVFAAQFDISILPYYFDVTAATGVHAATTPALLPATLQTQLAAFVFGNSDFAAGFKIGQQKMPVTGGWVYHDVYVYGKDEPKSIWDASAVSVPFPPQIAAVLQQGDMVVEFFYDSGGATDNKAVLVHRCQQVSYATMLDSLSSDRFAIDQIRYSIPDTTKVSQYANQLKLIRQSLFGRNMEDFVSPQSFKMPQQFQNGVIDIPLKKGIDKETLITTYVNYDVGQFDLSFFVWKTKKLVS